jgi:hypothetical protein
LVVIVLTPDTETLNSASTGRLDLRLGGAARDLEHDRIMLAEQGRLLGDVRAQDDIIVTDVDLAGLRLLASP